MERLETPSTGPEKKFKKWCLTCPPCSKQTGFAERSNVSDKK